MAPIRDDAAREERLAELIEEFRSRSERQAEALAALEEVSRIAREQVERGRQLHQEAAEKIELLKTLARRVRGRASARRKAG